MPAALTDDGISISYEVAGEGPPSLLCMHGWAGSGRYFDAMIEHLDLTRRRAVTFDLRGHRQSDPADDGYTLDQIAADALAVADAARLDEFLVVGFSMSARFAPVPGPGRTRASPRPDPRRRLSGGRDPAPDRAHRRLARPRGRRPAADRAHEDLRDEPDRAGAARALRGGRRDGSPRGAGRARCTPPSQPRSRIGSARSRRRRSSSAASTTRCSRPTSCETPSSRRSPARASSCSTPGTRSRSSCPAGSPRWSKRSSPSERRRPPGRPSRSAHVRRAARPGSVID